MKLELDMIAKTSGFLTQFYVGKRFNELLNCLLNCFWTFRGCLKWPQEAIVAQLLLDIWCQSLITKCRFRKNLYLKQIFFYCKDYVQSVAMIKILHFCTWQWLTLLMTLGFWMLLEWWLINTLPYNKTIKSQYLWWRNVNLIFSGIKQTNKWKFKQNINY